MRSCSKVTLHVKLHPIGLHLPFKPLDFKYWKPNLTGDHMNVGKLGLSLGCREGVYKLGTNKGLPVIKLNGHVAEVHAHLPVWICEVCKHSKISI